MQKLMTCLWFDDRIEDAVAFYTSVFPDAKVTQTQRYPDGGPMAGKVLTVTFELAGQEFMALNGGRPAVYTEAVSVVVRCESQKEVDHYWHALIEGGGEASQCGWLKDRFGLSWQIVPNALIRLMTDKDRARAARVTQALMGMRKIDIAALEKAAAGG